VTNPCDTIAAKCAASCAPPVSWRRWAARAVFAVLVALAVAAVEANLIEKAAATDSNCGSTAVCALVRVVDSSLSSGFAPLAIPR
jgi:hypothetical protein